MKRILLILLCTLLASLMYASAPKREFRGAWIQCVNGQFQGMSTQQMQSVLIQQLNQLQADGVNAIIFQVRPECDALYESSIEPWSRFLTGVQGKAPSPRWDPLQWMIEQCHKRGMELHAWINPFRAKTKGTTELAANHIGKVHPDRVFAYDNLLILNPGQPENRDYICRVVEDIVKRYDVDGLHIDDYFYPYPVAGQKIQDDKEYRLYGNGIGNIHDWRRYNVDLFIEQLGQVIHKTKPWVKFGVSPFGIYRNKKSDPNIGSNTNGLQNYDDLYADVLLWVNNGWIDYCVPQVYWEVGNKAADYKTLVEWWNRYAANRPLYIGEDIERTVKFADTNNPNRHQMEEKRSIRQKAANVKGIVLWYAKACVDDVGKYGTILRTDYWRCPALQPLMPFIDAKAPKKPKRVMPVWTEDGYMLFWTAPKHKAWDDEAVKYVVYRFSSKQKINLESTENIIAITQNNYIQLPYSDGTQRYIYVVTALDRLSNESKPAKVKVKL